jgi:hypothetical protein
MHQDLGYIDLEQKTLQPLDNPFGPRLSPMSWVRSVPHVCGPYTQELAETQSLTTHYFFNTLCKTIYKTPRTIPTNLRPLLGWPFRSRDVNLEAPAAAHRRHSESRPSDNDSPR